MSSTTTLPADPFGQFALKGIRGRWLAWCQRIGNRRLNKWSRGLLKRWVHGWVDTNIWGLKLRLASRGNLSEQRLLYWPAGLDLQERQAISEAIADGGVFFDIGANAGVYSLWAAALGPGVRVEAFEPDPDLCHRLRQNLARNSLNHVRLHQLALGDTEGSGSLVRGTGNLGCNRVAADETGEQVVLRRLPDVLSEIDCSRIDVMKIDIEGGECAALTPMFEELPRDNWPRLIICELQQQDESSPIGELLTSHGYQLAGRTRMNGLFRLAAT